MTVDWNGDDWTGVDGSWHALWSLQSLSLDFPMQECTNPGLTGKLRFSIQKRTALLVQLGEDEKRISRTRRESAVDTVAAERHVRNTACPAAIRASGVRTLHPYDVVQLSRDFDPIRRRLDFDLGAVAVVQARRYLDDFWGKVDSTDIEHWFVQAADQCLKAAGSTICEVLSLPALKAEGDAAYDLSQFRKRAQLKVVRQAVSVDLGLESQRPVEIAIEKNSQVPEGVAALWLTEEVDPAVMQI